MSRSVLAADLAMALAIAVLALILAPGLAIVAVGAIAVLLACLIGGVRDARARRRGRSGPGVRRHRGRPDVSARRPGRR